MKQRKFPDWFIQELAHIEDKKKAEAGEISSKNFIDFLCEKHGIYNQYVGSHIKISTGERLCGCPECAKQKRSLSRKQTESKKRRKYPQWFIDEIANDKDKEKAINGTLSTGDKIEFNCSIHGKYSQYVYSHIKINTGKSNHGCPKCGITKQTILHKQTKYFHKKEFPQWFIDDLAYKKDKTRAKNKSITACDVLTFSCKIHGKYKQSVGHHIKISTGEKMYGCPKCGKHIRIHNAKVTWSKKRINYPDWFINDLANEEDKIRASKNLLSTGDVVEFFCKKHGVYKQPVYNHIKIETSIKKAGCPKCGNQISRAENFLFEIVKNITNTIRHCKTQIRSSDTGYPLELDLYCPEKKIAFEYNGSKWHGEKTKLDSYYHFKKFNLCEKKSIRLISVFDKDWIFNNKKIIAFIKNTLNEKTKIYGRNTLVKKIETTKACDFLNEYCIKETYGIFDVVYGLFYNDELISVMSFSQENCNKDKEVDWCLNEYCVKNGYIVLGGASKLFSSFLREYKPRSIVAFSDCDYFSGEIYTKLGFSFDRYMELPYYWTNGNDFYSKEQCQLENLKEKFQNLYNDAIFNNATSREEYIMYKLGFYKVFRCGYKRWRWTKQ